MVLALVLFVLVLILVLLTGLSSTKLTKRKRL